MPEENQLTTARRKERLRVAAIDISEGVDARARDVAEASLLEDKERSSGITGWAKGLLKHNLAHEIFRQWAIAREKKKILDSGDLYGLEESGERRAHNRAVRATVDRFLGEYDEFVHTEAGEAKYAFGEEESERAIKERLEALVRDYATNGVSQEDFIEAKNRLFREAQGAVQNSTERSRITGKAADLEGAGQIYADNLLEIAEHVRSLAQHAGGLENLDIELDLVVGKAKLGARTEHEKTLVDQVVEKLQSFAQKSARSESALRRGAGIVMSAFNNEITAALATASALGSWFGRSTLGKAVTFGGSALVGGAIGGLREHKRLMRDRALHERERAQGLALSEQPDAAELQRRQVQIAAIDERLKTIRFWQTAEKRRLLAEKAALEGRDAPRRREMEVYARERVSARDTVTSLLRFLQPENGELLSATPENVALAAQALAETDVFVRSGDTQKIDRVAYSAPEMVEEERRDLDIARARVRAALRRAYNPAQFAQDGAEIDFDEYLLRMREIAGSEGAAAEGAERDRRKDVAFRELAKRRALWAGMSSAAFGGVIGVVGQEAVSAISESNFGLLDALRGKAPNSVGENFTPLEYLRRYLTDSLPFFDAATQIDVQHGETILRLPEGIAPVQASDGSFSLMLTEGRTTLVEGLHFDASGHLDAASKKICEDAGILVPDFPDRIIEHPGEMILGSKEPSVWLNQHGAKTVTRFGFHNDTVWRDAAGHVRGSDLNELRLDWGGESGLSVDGAGKPVFVMDASGVTNEGSFRAGETIRAADIMREGKMHLYLSLSESTQAHVVEVPVAADGTITILAESDIGRAMFKVEDGHAVFTGRFAEIGFVRDSEGDFENLGIFARHEGAGLDMVPATVGIPRIENAAVVGFDFPATHTWDVPPVIPLLSRKPLEPMRGRGSQVPSPGTQPSPERDHQLLPTGTFESGSLGSARGGESTTEALFVGYGGELGHYGERVDNSRDFKRLLLDEFRENPDLDVRDDREFIRNYLAREKPEYLAELERLIENEAPMSPEVEAVIPIPSYHEARNLEETFAHYARLAHPERFEIVLFENHPAAKGRDETAAVIGELRKKYPQLRITHLYKSFPERPTIGLIRKYLVDSVLLRKMQANLDHEVIIFSADADVTGMNKEYVDRTLNVFKDPSIDAAATKWDLPPEVYHQYPHLHAAQSMWHFMDRALLSKVTRAPETQGRASAFRSGIYAAIGGYNPEMEVAEDLEIGWRVRAARNWNPKRVRYVPGAKLFTNPRREVIKMLSGATVAQRYGDFAENEEVRRKSPEELMAMTKEYDREEMRKEIQSLYDTYHRHVKSQGGWADDAAMAQAFNRAMIFLGVKYEIHEDEVIILDDSVLVKGLERFRAEEKSAPFTKTEVAGPEVERVQEPFPAPEEPPSDEPIEEAPDSGLETQVESEETDVEIDEDDEPYARASKEMQHINHRLEELMKTDEGKDLMQTLIDAANGDPYDDAELKEICLDLLWEEDTERRGKSEEEILERVKELREIMQQDGRKGLLTKGELPNLVTPLEYIDEAVRLRRARRNKAEAASRGKKDNRRKSGSRSPASSP